MFTPIHLLPRYSAERYEKYKDRWNHGEGPTVQEKVLQMLKDGAGEDFLEWDFQNGRLPILEHEGDLRGLTIFGMEIDFPHEDNFTGVDFSYTSLYHTILRHGTFSDTNFSFTKFYNCEFVNCRFALTHFYGATLEKSRFVGCDFLEHDDMVNCDLKNVTMSKCFYNASFFDDCRFDQQTTIDDPLKSPNDTAWFRLQLEKQELAEIFRVIKEGYRAGQVSKKARMYFLKQRKAITRYNTDALPEKARAYFLEIIAGYGISPLRVLMSMLIVFLAFSVAFTIKIGFLNGFLLSAGAFFTFGANTQFLQDIGAIWYIVYILESFFGIAFMALFVTVLANLWFGER